jgi:hypothetical protein
VGRKESDEGNDVSLQNLSKAGLKASFLFFFVAPFPVQPLPDIAPGAKSFLPSF